jgi:hypothetical protein
MNLTARTLLIVGGSPEDRERYQPTCCTIQNAPIPVTVNLTRFRSNY